MRLEILRQMTDDELECLFVLWGTQKEVAEENYKKYPNYKYADTYLKEIKYAENEQAKIISITKERNKGVEKCD